MLAALNLIEHRPNISKSRFRSILYPFYNLPRCRAELHVGFEIFFLNGIIRPEHALLVMVECHVIPVSVRNDM